MRCHSEISSVLLGEGIISSEISFDLAEDRRLVTPKHARHLGDWDFRVPPAFNSRAFLHAQLRVTRSRGIFSLSDN